MPWHVVYTKPRNEKKVTEQLEKSGIIVYCPLVTQMKQWSDRKKKVQTPLIPSYVFVNVIENERQKVLQISGVLRFVFWLGKVAVVRDDEIKALQEGLKDVVNSAEIIAYKKGDLIKIPTGPFQGKVGKIEDIQNTNIRLLLSDLGIMITLTKSI